MIVLNALLVAWVHCSGRIITWRDPPAVAIYSRGYGYNYGKTDN